METHPVGLLSRVSSLPGRGQGRHLHRLLGSPDRDGQDLMEEGFKRKPEKKIKGSLPSWGVDTCLPSPEEGSFLHPPLCHIPSLTLFGVSSSK